MTSNSDESDFQRSMMDFQQSVSDFQRSVTDFQRSVLERLDRIDQRLNKVDQRLDDLERDQRETNIRLEAFQKGSEGVVGMAKTIIITAGASVIFAPLLRELAPAIAAFLNNDSLT
jgi:uncharacterized protein YlxW (UPF0749 family)